MTRPPGTATWTGTALAGSCHPLRAGGRRARREQVARAGSTAARARAHDRRALEGRRGGTRAAAAAVVATRRGDEGRSRECDRDDGLAHLMYLTAVRTQAGRPGPRTGVVAGMTSHAGCRDTLGVVPCRAHGTSAGSGLAPD